MKKYLILLAGLLLLISLSACGSESKTAKSSNSISKEVSSSSSMPSRDVTNFSESSSSNSIHTSSGAQSDLGQARIALYTAGINSSSISDDQLLKYWNEAKSKGTDFVAYVKAHDPSLN